MQGLADEEGIDENLLTSGWIQIGLGSANNTACDLKSCQASSQWLKIPFFRENNNSAGQPAFSLTEFYQTFSYIFASI